jgi:DNA-binding transcriptional ArsR family regulator
MGREKILFDPKSPQGIAKRVLVSDKPDEFRAAAGKIGQKILSLLATGPKYPAEIARTLGVYHQTVYYHMGRLERAGLITRLRKQVIRGGEATIFALSSDGYAVEFPVSGEVIPSLSATSRPKALGLFFSEFTKGGELDGWVVVGSPVPHGEGGTQARDGHYAIQLGIALGQFIRLPRVFPVKLDVDVKSEKLTVSNLIIVGGPRTNIIAADLNPHLPIRFKEGAFWGSIVDSEGKLYTSELDCIVAKVRNPWNAEKNCLLAAGLTGAGTKAAIIGICNEAEKVLRGYSGGDYACVLRGVDRDGDGKVDSAEVLNVHRS